ncbi:MAG: hypothetical protein ACOCVY_02585 [Patescibacteria group bacterium]
MFKEKTTPVIYATLVIFILALSANIVINSGVIAAPFSGCEQRYVRPVTVNYYEGYVCEENIPDDAGPEYKNYVDFPKERKESGDLMFSYYGEDSNCWDISNDYEKNQCYERYPYGGAGTFRIGGNYIMSGAGEIKLPGRDGAGMHWIMTTTTEPMGNVLGFHSDSNDVTFGDNIIAKGSLNLSKTDKEIKIGHDDLYVNVDKKNRYTPDLERKNIDIIDFNGGLQIFDEIFCGLNNSCDQDKRGDDYMYESNMADFESLIKYSGTGYLCKDKLSWEDSKVCHIYEYRAENVWDFYDKYDNLDREIVKYDCKSGEENCHSQPYIQYKIMDYSAESDTSGKTSGVEGTVRCMEEECTDCEEGVFVEKPEKRDNISCKECGDSINSRPFGCQ